MAIKRVLNNFNSCKRTKKLRIQLTFPMIEPIEIILKNLYFVNVAFYEFSFKSLKKALHKFTAAPNNKMESAVV